MKTWTPLWSSTLESTLWEEPWNVRLLFLTLLMLRDPDHVVRESLRVIAKKANLDPDKRQGYRLCEEAMKVLMAPDERSEEAQEYEGRRVKVTPEGYYEILNAQKYVDQMADLWRRLRKSQAQRARRQREKDQKQAGGGVSQAERQMEAARKNGDLATVDRLEELQDRVPPGTYSEPPVEEGLLSDPPEE